MSPLDRSRRRFLRVLWRGASAAACGGVRRRGLRRPAPAANARGQVCPIKYEAIAIVPPFYPDVGDVRPE